jgi:hypothetical protein
MISKNTLPHHRVGKISENIYQISYVRFSVLCCKLKATSHSTFNLLIGRQPWSHLILLVSDDSIR